MTEQERTDKLHLLHGFVVSWRKDKARNLTPTSESLDAAEMAIRDLLASEREVAEELKALRIVSDSAVRYMFPVRRSAS